MDNTDNGHGQHKAQATPGKNPLSGYGAAAWPLARFNSGNWSSGGALGAQIGVQRFWSVRKLRRALEEGYQVRLSGWRWVQVYATRWPLLVMVSVWALTFLPWWDSVPLLRFVVLVAVVVMSNSRDFARAQERAAARWLARHGLEGRPAVR